MRRIHMISLEMDGPVLLLTALSLLCKVSLARTWHGNMTGVPDEQRLYDQIMKKYLNTVRPMVNNSQPLEVLFSMRLNQIVSLDERQQVLTTNVFIDQTWTDPGLAWDPTEFKDVRSLRIPADQVWRPDTFIYNNADNGSTGFILGTYIQIRHTGSVTWPVPVRLSSSCIVKIAYFPFDYQYCMVRFGSWIYSHSLVDYNVREDVVSVDLSTYIKNSEWELLSMRLEKNVANRSRGLGLHPHLTAILYLKRNTFYYLFNIIVPCVMLSMLTLMTFWLSPTSGEKVTLGLSVFLAFSMFMLLIAEEVPASSDAVPLIGIFLCVVMTMTSLSVICAVLVTNLHNRGSKLRPAPRWIATLCIRYLAIPFRVNRDVQLLANTIYLSDHCKFFIIHDNRCATDKQISRGSHGGRISDIPEETLSESARQSLDAGVYDRVDVPSASQRFFERNSHDNHNGRARSPPHSHDHHQISPPDENLAEENIVEEDQGIELNDRATDPLLSQNTHKCNYDLHSPYKMMCSHDKNNIYDSASCSQHGHQETPVDDDATPESNSSQVESSAAVMKSPSSLTIPPSLNTASAVPHVSQSFNMQGLGLSKPRTNKEELQFEDVYHITPCLTHETFCECHNNDEDVWVLRDDFSSPSPKSHRQSCTCLNESDSDAEVLQELIPKHSPAHTSLLSKASYAGAANRPRRHRPNRKRRSHSVYENPKLVLKRAKIMIAEWCTIAKVVDRILFTLSLFATVFAYVFLLFVVPSEHNIYLQNVTFANSINTGQYRWH